MTLFEKVPHCHFFEYEAWCFSDNLIELSDSQKFEYSLFLAQQPIVFKSFHEMTQIMGLIGSRVWLECFRDKPEENFISQTLMKILVFQKLFRFRLFCRVSD